MTKRELLPVILMEIRIQRAILVLQPLSMELTFQVANSQMFSFRKSHQQEMQSGRNLLSEMAQIKGLT